MCAAADDGHRQREESVTLGCGVDLGRDLAAVAQPGTHAAQCLLLVREIDQADARDYRIEGAGIQFVQAFAIDNMATTVLMPMFTGFSRQFPEVLPYPKFIDFALPGNRAYGVCPDDIPEHLHEYCDGTSNSGQG